MASKIYVPYLVYPLFLLILLSCNPPAFAQTAPQINTDKQVLQNMLALLEEGSREQKEACEWLGNFNDISVMPVLIDALYFVKLPDEWDWAVKKISGQNFQRDWHRWMEWLGKKDFESHSAYPEFKLKLFGQIDPFFTLFLNPAFRRTIRLDEIVWGGVRKDGIPALDNPKMIKAEEASYMNEDDDVFGLSVNGQYHAYPLRILNWHEMLNTVISGKAITLTYCTLCGSAIPYETKIEETTFTFGSSGLLYRSNKLMYDWQTNSLWSSLEGKPVVGPLVGQDIRLNRHYVVRTTWEEWKKINPSTLVLDINTGFKRDYSPGGVYADYFKSKNTMFPVAWRDKRLKAKDWVFGMIINGTAKAYPLRKLRKKSILHDTIENESIILLLDTENLTVRAYQSAEYIFSDQKLSDVIKDSNGNEWLLSEDALIRQTDKLQLNRLPGHLSFWFGWFAFFPETQVWDK